MKIDNLINEGKNVCKGILVITNVGHGEPLQKPLSVSGNLKVNFSFEFSTFPPLLSPLSIGQSIFPLNFFKALKFSMEMETEMYF